LRAHLDRLFVLIVWVFCTLGCVPRITDTRSYIFGVHDAARLCSPSWLENARISPSPQPHAMLPPICLSPPAHPRVPPLTRAAAMVLQPQLAVALPTLNNNRPSCCLSWHCTQHSWRALNPGSARLGQAAAALDLVGLGYSFHFIGWAVGIWRWITSLGASLSLERRSRADPPGSSSSASPLLCLYGQARSQKKMLAFLLFG
jgi:hypothetical protein